MKEEVLKMKSRKTKRISVIANPTNAQGTQESVREQNFNLIYAEETKTEKEQDDAIHILERYLSISKKGKIVVSAPKKIIKQIGESNYIELINGIKQTNAMIDKGYLFCDNNFNITLTPKYQKTNKLLQCSGNTAYLDHQTAQTSMTFAAATGNRNGVEWYWWGFKLFLDSANSNRVAAGTTAGAVVSTLIPEPVISKAVMISLGLASALFLYANAEGRGTYCRYNYSPIGSPVIFTGVYSQ